MQRIKISSGHTTAARPRASIAAPRHANVDDKWPSSLVMDVIFGLPAGVSRRINGGLRTSRPLSGVSRDFDSDFPYAWRRWREDTKKSLTQETPFSGQPMPGPSLNCRGPWYDALSARLPPSSCDSLAERV